MAMTWVGQVVCGVARSGATQRDTRGDPDALLIRPMPVQLQMITVAMTEQWRCTFDERSNDGRLIGM